MIDDLFGAVDRRLFAAGAQCRQAWPRVTAVTVTTSTTTSSSAAAVGHTALEGGGTGALVGLCVTAATGVSEAAVAFTAGPAGRLGAALDVRGSSRTGIVDVSAPRGGAFASGDADTGSVGGACAGTVFLGAADEYRAGGGERGA